MIVEINSRLLVARFRKSTNNRQFTLVDIPKSYWKNWYARGFTHIWLMGVWQNTKSSVREYAFVKELKQEYSDALPDWSDQDVWGSPYAIDSYILHEDLGKQEDLGALYKKIKSIGLRLILDFVPNHFNARSSLIQKHHDCFLSTEHPSPNPHIFYKHHGRYYAHGKDPYFPAWQDTVQVDYSLKETHDFMLSQLSEIAEVCDGVRCDMAMLVLNDIFAKTWNKVMPDQEFWSYAINEIKEKYKSFQFIAEAYWDLEWKLQSLGFDYTYDKKFRDLLLHNSPEEAKGHLMADEEFQQKSVRFLENHDEDRAITAFGLQKSRAAALITYTVPGFRFFFDGQFAGSTIRLPVQLARNPVEHSCQCPLPKDIVESGCSCTTSFYNNILQLLSHPIIQTGEWQLLSTSGSLFSWVWKLHEEAICIMVNYSDSLLKATCPAELNAYQYKSELFNQIGIDQWPEVQLRAYQGVAVELNHKSN